MRRRKERFQGMRNYNLDVDEFIEWFNTELSPVLTFEKKESLYQRLYEEGMRRFYMDDEYPISLFPELERHWERDRLTKNELANLAYDLKQELRKAYLSHDTA
jgi:hypothetical protein